MKKWSENVMFVPELREEAREWCKAREVEPSDVPIEGLIREGQAGYIEIETIDRDENGVIKWDFDAPGDVDGRPIMKWYVVKGPMPPEHLTEEMSI